MGALMGPDGGIANAMGSLGGGNMVSNGMNNMPEGELGVFEVMNNPLGGLDQRSQDLLKKRSRGQALMGASAELLSQGYSATPHDPLDRLAGAAMLGTGLYQQGLASNGMAMRRQGQIGSEDQMIGEVGVTGQKRPMDPSHTGPGTGGLFTDQGASFAHGIDVTSNYANSNNANPFIDQPFYMQKRF